MAHHHSIAIRVMMTRSLVLCLPELDVKAVTSSAGNQTPDKTLRNVLRMLTLLKRTIFLAGGASSP
jgi:pyrimidine-specific ribonucleoside hydrolase